MVSSVKDILNNSFIIVFARIIGMSAGFLIVPFILTLLNIVGYGVWESIIALTAITTLLMTALTQTLTWRITQSIAVGNIDEVNRWFGIGLFLTIVQTVLFVLLVSVYGSHIGKLFSIPIEYVEDFTFLLPIVVGLTLSGGIHETTGALVSSYQKSGVVILYKSIAIAIGQIISVLFLYMNYGLYSVAYGLLANMLTATLMLHFATRKYGKGVEYNFQIPALNEIRVSRNFFLLTLIGSITLLFRNHIAKVLIANYSSMESVANYGISSRLASLVFLTVTFIMSPTITAVSKSMARKDHEDIQSIYKETIGIFAFVSCLITVILCVLAESIYVFWIGFYSDELITFTLTLIVGQSIAVVITAVGVSVCTGLGRRDIETYYILINLALNIALLFLLLPVYDSVGAVISSSLSWAIASFFFLYFMHKKVELPKIASIQAVKSIVVALIFIVIARTVLKSVELEMVDRLTAFFEFSLISGLLIIAYSAIMHQLKLLPNEILAASKKFLNWNVK